MPLSEQEFFTPYFYPHLDGELRPFDDRYKRDLNQPYQLPVSIGDSFGGHESYYVNPFFKLFELDELFYLLKPYMRWMPTKDGVVLAKDILQLLQELFIDTQDKSHGWIVKTDNQIAYVDQDSKKSFVNWLTCLDELYTKNKAFLIKERNTLQYVLFDCVLGVLVHYKDYECLMNRLYPLIDTNDDLIESNNLFQTVFYSMVSADKKFAYDKKTNRVICYDVVKNLTLSYTRKAWLEKNLESLRVYARGVKNNTVVTSKQSWYLSHLFEKSSRLFIIAGIIGSRIRYSSQNEVQKTFINCPAQIDLKNSTLNKILFYQRGGTYPGRQASIGPINGGNASGFIFRTIESINEQAMVFLNKANNQFPLNQKISLPDGINTFRITIENVKPPYRITPYTNYLVNPINYIDGKGYIGLSVGTVQTEQEPIRVCYLLYSSEQPFPPETTEAVLKQLVIDSRASEIYVPYEIEEVGNKEQRITITSIGDISRSGKEALYIQTGTETSYVLLKIPPPGSKTDLSKLTLGEGFKVVGKFDKRLYNNLGGNQLIGISDIDKDGIPDVVVKSTWHPNFGILFGQKTYPLIVNLTKPEGVRFTFIKDNHDLGGMPNFVCDASGGQNNLVLGRPYGGAEPTGIYTDLIRPYAHWNTSTTIDDTILYSGGFHTTGQRVYSLAWGENIRGNGQIPLLLSAGATEENNGYILWKQDAISSPLDLRILNGGIGSRLQYKDPRVNYYHHLSSGSENSLLFHTYIQESNQVGYNEYILLFDCHLGSKEYISSVSLTLLNSNSYLKLITSENQQSYLLSIERVDINSKGEYANSMPLFSIVQPRASRSSDYLVSTVRVGNDWFIQYNRIQNQTTTIFSVLKIDEQGRLIQTKDIVSANNDILAHKITNLNGQGKSSDLLSIVKFDKSTHATIFDQNMHGESRFSLSSEPAYRRELKIAKLQLFDGQLLNVVAYYDGRIQIVRANIVTAIAMYPEFQISMPGEWASPSYAFVMDKTGGFGYITFQSLLKGGLYYYQFNLSQDGKKAELQSSRLLVNIASSSEFYVQQNQDLSFLVFYQNKQNQWVYQIFSASAKSLGSEVPVYNHNMVGKSFFVDSLNNQDLLIGYRDITTPSTEIFTKKITRETLFINETGVKTITYLAGEKINIDFKDELTTTLDKSDKKIQCQFQGLNQSGLSGLTADNCYLEGRAPIFGGVVHLLLKANDSISSLNKIIRIESVANFAWLGILLSLLSVCVVAMCGCALSTSVACAIGCVIQKIKVTKQRENELATLNVKLGNKGELISFCSIFGGGAVIDQHYAVLTLMGDLDKGDDIKRLFFIVQRVDTEQCYIEKYELKCKESNDLKKKVGLSRLAIKKHSLGPSVNLITYFNKIILSKGKNKHYKTISWKITNQNAELFNKRAELNQKYFNKTLVPYVLINNQLEIPNFFSSDKEQTVFTWPETMLDEFDLLPKNTDLSSYIRTRVKPKRFNIEEESELKEVFVSDEIDKNVDGKNQLIENGIKHLSNKEYTKAKNIFIKLLYDDRHNVELYKNLVCAVDGERKNISEKTVIGDSYNQYKIKTKHITLDMGKNNLPKIIGKGAYGIVYAGRIKKNKDEHPVAIKILQKNIDSEEEPLSKHSKNEIEMMMRFSGHPNFPRCFGWYIDDNKIKVVTELAENGTLTSFLKKNKNLSNEEKLNLILDILQAEHYLRLHDIYHRDIKPDNILIDKNGKACFTDFGNTRQYLSKETQQIAGTPLYIDPWLYFKKHDEYDESCEVFSIGLLIGEIWNNGPLNELKNFKVENDIYEFYISKNLTPTLPSAIPPCLKKIIHACLNSKHNERQSVENILQTIRNNKNKILYYVEEKNYEESFFDSNVSFYDEKLDENKKLIEKNNMN